MSLKLNSNSINYNVATVLDLTSIVNPSINDTVVVTEEGRGGVFIYRADGTSNGGTIFDSSSTGKWHRQYEGSVNVKWFGAKTDGTNNTAIYTNMINGLPEGTTIEWTAENYTGGFVSNKSFILKGNGATIVPVSSFGIAFQGSIGSYTALSSAPAFGDLSLSGISGLSGHTIVSLYSGTVRTSDNSHVNYETLEVKDTGVVVDKVYSDQDGGTPTYAVIDTIDNVSVSGFKVLGGVTSSIGVYIEYAKNVTVSNISMVGGAGSTVSVRDSYNININHIQRREVSAYGSGQGYNIQAIRCKYAKIYNIYSYLVRHSVDCDSSYVVDINNVISPQNYNLSVIEAAHNGYGGFFTIKDCNITSNGYAINFSGETSTPTGTRINRNIVIDNINIANDVQMGSNEFYVGVYFGNPSKDISISNIFIKNETASLFDYNLGNYNNQYYIIRMFDPQGNTNISNISTSAATWAVYAEYISTECSINIENISVPRYKNLVVAGLSAAPNRRGSISIDGLYFEDSSTVHGEAPIWINSGTYGLTKLMVYGMNELPDNADYVIKYNNNTVPVPLYSYIDTSGFIGNLGDVCTGTSKTLTQYEMLRYGEQGQGYSSGAMNLTFPRPITSGNKFNFLHRGGAGTITETTTSTAMTVDKQYEFIANGAVWKKQRVYSGVTL